MPTSDSREDKLPQWAQTELTRLRQKLDDATRMCAEQTDQLAEYRTRVPGAPMSIELEPYRSTASKRVGQTFAAQTTVRIKARPKASSPTFEIRVTEEGFADIAALQGSLIIMPSGGQNRITVATAQDYALAREAELAKWEARVQKQAAAKP
jgi:glucose/arabinose dehydrogenase